MKKPLDPKKGRLNARVDFAPIACVLMLSWFAEFLACQLRRTKRHISQEINEWEEDNKSGEVDEAPDLTWGFMGDDAGDNQVGPGYFRLIKWNHPITNQDFRQVCNFFPLPDFSSARFADGA